MSLTRRGTGPGRASGLGRDVFRSGQVAQLVGVNVRTVCGWIDSGLLPSYRLPPAGRVRRVTRAALLRFLVEHGIGHALRSLGVQGDESEMVSGA